MSDTIGAAAQRGVTSAPSTVSALLRTLHLDHSTVAAQRPVIRGWLVDHPPSRELRLSLRSNGYGQLLRDRPL